MREDGQKYRSGASPQGGCSRGKEWEAGYTLGLAEGDLTCLLNRITLRFDARVVTPWAEVHLRSPQRVLSAFRDVGWHRGPGPRTPLREPIQ